MNKLAKAIDNALPDYKLEKDISQILWGDGNGIVELEGLGVHIPKGTKVEVVSKAFFLERYEIGFGNCLRTLLAIGGVVSQEHGVLSAQFCFATLYYTEDGNNIITVDFHKEMR